MKFLTVGNNSLPIDALSFYWRWTPQVPSSHCRALHLRSLWVLSVSHLPGIWYILEGLPTSYLQKLPVSILLADPQGFSPVPPLSFLSPFPPMSFLLPPKWDWGILTWTLLLVSLLEFYGLYPGNSVHILANIHLLVVHTMHIILCPSYLTQYDIF